MRVPTLCRANDNVCPVAVRGGLAEGASCVALTGVVEFPGTGETMFRPFTIGAVSWPVAAVLLLAIGCDVDHGIAPLESCISGTITYEGTWPDATEEIAVVASASFPPSGLTELILSEPLPLWVSQYEYCLYVPRGRYELVGVAWRAVDEPWDLNSLVGKYTTGGTSQPGVVVVATDTSRVTGIDIGVDFSRGSMAGTVTFLGTWPESTDEVRVAIYATYPPTNFFAIDWYSDPFPLGVSTHDYTVSLLPGTYEWVIVAWREQGKFWGPEGFLGMYRAPSDTTRPASVVIEQGKVTPDIDIAVDFAQMGVLPPELQGMVGSGAVRP